MRTEAQRRPAAWLLPAGDAVAIALFAVIGLASHDEGITVAGLARNALPILAAWFLVAAFARTYARPGLSTLLATWALAVPIGVVIRAIALNREADGSQVTFGIVTMIVTLMLLLAWRGIRAVVARPRAGRSPAGRSL